MMDLTQAIRDLPKGVRVMFEMVYGYEDFIERLTDFDHNTADDVEYSHDPNLSKKQNASAALSAYLSGGEWSPVLREL